MEEKERERKDGKDATCRPPPSPPPPGADADTDDDAAARTDVCSERFDPLLALYSPTVSIPFPNIKCFNNVAEYEGFLKGGRGRAKPENVERRRQKAMKGAADPERIERLKRLVVKKPESEEEEGNSATPRPRRERTHKNVLTRMALSKGSPLGELYRCVEERIRVKVHIRTFKGLRGVCTGFVVAFDKFWNMAMVDVDETYRQPLLGEAFYHEKPLTISRLFEKLKLQESSGVSDTNQGEATKQLHGDQKVSTQSQCARPTGKTGDRKPESERSDNVAAKQGKHEVAGKQREKEECQQKDSRAYSKVRTRHIRQLFIRGENIILVNPQPL